MGVECQSIIEHVSNRYMCVYILYAREGCVDWRCYTEYYAYLEVHEVCDLQIW
jgi:hypothetical protein